MQAMVVCTCIPSTLEPEAKGSGIQGQSGLHSDTLWKKEELKV